MKRIEGVGVYIRRLAPKGTPSKVAAIADRNGVTHVHILGAWQQPDKSGKVRTGAPNRKVLSDYVTAFADRGITCGLWYYPWAGSEARLLDVLHAQCKSAKIELLLNDAELGYKWIRNQASNAREAVKGIEPTHSKEFILQRSRVLVEGIDDIVGSEGLTFGHGFTSYGVPSFHPNYPWEVFSKHAKFVSPQLYRAGPRLIKKGISQWMRLVDDAPVTLVPSIGAFGPKSKLAMDDHLRLFIGPNIPEVDGFLVWSWMQIDRGEWQTLSRWSRWLANSTCG